MKTPPEIIARIPSIIKLRRVCFEADFVLMFCFTQSSNPRAAFSCPFAERVKKNRWLRKVPAPYMLEEIWMGRYRRFSESGTIIIEKSGLCVNWKTLSVLTT
jgi:hypothetical protein